MKRLNILLLGAGNRVSLCEWLIRASKSYNRKVNIFSLEKEKYAPISKYAKIIPGLPWKDPEFVDQLIGIVNKEKINIVLPLMDAATVALADCKHFVEEATSTKSRPVWCVVSRFQLCEIFNNKVLSDTWFRDNNILVPSIDPKNAPAIVKKAEGYGSRGIEILKYEDELIDFKNDHYHTLTCPTRDFILQEYIEGVEFTVDTYITRNGYIPAIVPRIRLAVVNGEVSKSVTKREPELIKIVEDILLNSEAKGRLEGPLTFQFINKKDTNKWYMVEINPRFAGGSICSFGAGANFCECVIAEYLGLDIPDCYWKEGVLMLRANQEIWDHMEL